VYRHKLPLNTRGNGMLAKFTVFYWWWCGCELVQAGSALGALLHLDHHQTQRHRASPGPDITRTGPTSPGSNVHQVTWLDANRENRVGVSGEVSHPEPNPPHPYVSIHIYLPHPASAFFDPMEYNTRIFTGETSCLTTVT
jgi:hypothetical protein